jgi:hypothetical protein
MSKSPKLGPTGSFPHGKLDPDDEGALLVSISHDEKRTVRIDFGTKIAWLGLPAPQAIAFAANILKHATGAENFTIGSVEPLNASDLGEGRKGDQKVEP